MSRARLSVGPAQSGVISLSPQVSVPGIAIHYGPSPRSRRRRVHLVVGLAYHSTALPIPTQSDFFGRGPLSLLRVFPNVGVLLSGPGDGPGRGEITRMTLAVGGIPYDDFRYGPEFQTLTATKPGADDPTGGSPFPFNQVSLPQHACHCRSTSQRPTRTHAAPAVRSAPRLHPAVLLLLLLLPSTP